ncbi:MAG TPA: cytochrome c peroxidase [Puia sp.]|jgi:cytochrome c peroxidase|nr:cytochrome c peroxidase [Puia sp.]
MRACSILFLLATILALSASRQTSPGDHVLQYVAAGFSAFSKSADTLDYAIQRLTPDNPRSIRAAKQALIRCRLRYKTIEFFLEYFFRSSALIYNQPAKYEAEEPFLEYEAPRGLQYIESLLFGALNDSTLTLLNEQSTAVSASARDLRSLLYDFQPDDGPLMESLRLELIRVMALDITGYDAPLLETGISEAAASMDAFSACLQPRLGMGGEADSVRRYLAATRRLLHSARGFDGFDRLSFLTDAALPLQQHLSLWIEAEGLQYASVPALNYHARDLFSPDAIRVEAFPNAEIRDSQNFAAIGRRLFTDKTLSVDGSRSCATCHRPDRYFSDGQVVSPALPRHAPLTRNTPSLLYAAYQYSQFWDGRSQSIQDQVRTVLANPAEMGADTTRMDMRQTTAALAAYIRSLKPFNSRVDRFFAGDHRTLAPAEIRGFNLFMGKARCGTCHFAPIFNGLRPPLYDRSEYEVLGTPATDDLQHPKADPDSGRFGVYPIPFYRGAFKTPTVRNTAATAPYMHNGRFSDMSRLLDFYNKGGGTGIGLSPDNQTLDSRPLHLSPAEIRDLTAFITALTDQD